MLVAVIRSFRHKGLRRLHQENDAFLLSRELVPRVCARLLVFESAERLDDVNVLGLDLHKLRGKPLRYSVHVNGPWCITFEWNDGEALRVDFENYHERKSSR